MIWRVTVYTNDGEEEYETIDEAAAKEAAVSFAQHGFWLMLPGSTESSILIPPGQIRKITVELMEKYSRILSRIELVR